MRRKLLRYALLILAFILLLSIGGVFATWKYPDNNIEDISSSVGVSVELNEFVHPLFTVTYMVGEDVYLKEYHTDSSIDYKVIGAPNGFANFKQWVNANGVAVTTIPKNNTDDYTLYATWLNRYTINFIDVRGALIYSEEFTEGSSKLSAEGQVVVDEWLTNENRIENVEHIYVTWSAYELEGATSDIIVRPVYDYQGYLRMDAVYGHNGAVDYYKVLAVNTLPAEVVVPGDIGDVPVKIIERITNEDGEEDWDNYENTVTKITIQENIERLEWNSLAWTPNLAEVNLPNSINYMDKNVFSRNDLFGNDKKKLTINFNGTRQEWKAILENSSDEWDGGLKTGSVIYCTDGYFKSELFRGWREYSY